MPIMSKDEISRYLGQSKPAGGPTGSAEDLELQKWYFASMNREWEILNKVPPADRDQYWQSNFNLCVKMLATIEENLEAALRGRR